MQRRKIGSSILRPPAFRPTMTALDLVDIFYKQLKDNKPGFVLHLLKNDLKNA
jgi:hypothetical protein